jgi:hypothetical protein
LRLDPAWAQLTVASMTATSGAGQRDRDGAALDPASVQFRHHQRHHRWQSGVAGNRRDAEVADLIFDGDVQSTGGDFGFARNRISPLRWRSARVAVGVGDHRTPNWNATD